MASTTKKTRTGRPSVDTEAITLRLHVDLIRQIDEYRRAEVDLPNRQEAIRRLVTFAIAQKGKKR